MYWEKRRLGKMHWVKRIGKKVIGQNVIGQNALGKMSIGKNVDWEKCIGKNVIGKNGLGKIRTPVFLYWLQIQKINEI